VLYAVIVYGVHLNVAFCLKSHVPKTNDVAGWDSEFGIFGLKPRDLDLPKSKKIALFFHSVGTEDQNYVKCCTVPEK